MYLLGKKLWECIKSDVWRFSKQKYMFSSSNEMDKVVSEHASTYREKKVNNEIHRESKYVSASSHTRS